MSNFNAKNNLSAIRAAKKPKPKVEPIDHSAFRTATEWLRRALRIAETTVFSNRQKSKGTASVKLWNVRADRMPSNAAIQRAIDKTLVPAARPVRWEVRARFGFGPKMKSLTFYYNIETFRLLDIGGAGTEAEDAARITANKGEQKAVAILEDAAKAIRDHKSGKQPMKTTTIKVALNPARPVLKQKKRSIDKGSLVLVDAAKGVDHRLRWSDNGVVKAEVIDQQVFEALRYGLGLKVVRCRS